MALLDNQGKPPNVYSSSLASPSAVVAYWAAYAKGGDPGARGLTGATGPQGLQGSSGNEGAGRISRAARISRRRRGCRAPMAAPDRREPRASYADAHIVSITCDGGGFNYQDDSDNVYCIAACPSGETGVTGWYRSNAEGWIKRVVDPWIADNVGEAFEGLYVVYEWDDLGNAANFYASMAIACIPGVPPPLPPGD